MDTSETDQLLAEVRGGDLNENDQVVIGLSSAARAQSQTQVTNPFQSAPPRGMGAFR